MESAAYVVAKHLINKLLSDGLITQEEYHKIDEENRKIFTC